MLPHLLSLLDITDGSNDDKIAPEGLWNYQVPSPHQYLEPAVQLPGSNHVKFEEPPPSDTMVVDENNFLPDDQELNKHRQRGGSYSWQFCWLENQSSIWKWLFGKINYYSKLHEEYYVLYEDDTKDYISLDNIGGAEVQLL